MIKDASSCSVRILKADIAVAARWMVSIQRHLGILDSAKLAEVLIQPLRVVQVVFGDLWDKNTRVRLLYVLDIGVLRETLTHSRSPWAFNVYRIVDEVSQLLASPFKCYLIPNLDDSCTELFVHVANNVWLHLQDIAYRALYQVSNHISASAVFRQIIEIEGCAFGFGWRYY